MNLNFKAPERDKNYLVRTSVSRLNSNYLKLNHILYRCFENVECREG